MKKLLVITALMAISLNASALCTTDSNWNMTCTQSMPLNDYRNDSNSPRIYDSGGAYRGNLNGNAYDPNSISNPYGRYGSKYSTDSLNNPYSPR